jgi:hypothetical protein
LEEVNGGGSVWRGRVIVVEEADAVVVVVVVDVDKMGSEAEVIVGWGTRNRAREGVDVGRFRG